MRLRARDDDDDDDDVAEDESPIVYRPHFAIPYCRTTRTVGQGEVEDADAADDLSLMMTLVVNEDRP